MRRGIQAPLTIVSVIVGFGAFVSSALGAEQPYIAWMSPTSGTPGTVITIKGSGLADITTAWIGSGHDVGIQNVSSGALELTVPSDATTGKLVLSNGSNWAWGQVFTVAGAGTSSTQSGSTSGASTSGTSTSGTATSSSQPYIQSFTPTSGGAGTVITVTGSGLSNITTAWLGSAQNVPVTDVSGTVVKLTVPEDANTGHIGIASGSNWSFSASAFTVTASVASTGTSGSGSGTGSSGSGSESGLVVKVDGNHLVDASGNVVQLRGVNVSGLEFVAVQGWDASNPWGGQTGTATPDWTTIKSWDVNAVRIPLNEASWLGYTCTDATGASHNPDPGANYQATVASAVAGATAAGLYVILDLHWTAPAAFCPLAQNQMADADNSVRFWSSIATEFKSDPNVLFELFNEPFVGDSSPSAADWTTIMQGGPQTNYVTGGTPYQANYNWTVAGMQQMLTAIRDTGATNVVLVGSPSWSQDLSDWVANKPTDPDNQIAAVWHAYSNASSDPTASLPLFGSIAYTWVQSVLDAGYPVVITETGDYNAAGTTGAPFLQNLLPWADARQVSYFGWAWDVWEDSANVLITDAAGDPTPGYGVYFKQHLACVSSGTSNCP